MTDEETPLDPQVSKSVAKLADLLRKVGSRVLTNSCALSLSWPVYHQISTALSLFASHTSDHAKYLDCKLILDLEYLKSFLSRVPHLRLYHSNSQEFSGLIYLAGLIHLRHLDLKRLPVHLIQDLDSVRPQLRSLSLSKCSFSVEELLSFCLGSQPNPSPWSSLSHLTMSHCSLTTLSSSLSCTPHLTHLDCSHNLLSTTPGVELLSNLSHLNLSYNNLSRVPPTHGSALVTQLSLAYNRLEQLSPLSEMSYLEQLDLSGNCLMHHDALAPISSLSKLLQLDIRHNPLSTHPKHRVLASSWLNPALASAAPILDNFPLSRAETVMIGSSRIIISPSVSPASPLGELNDRSVTSIPFNLDDLPESASCTGSREGSLVSGYTITTVGGTRRKKGKRKKKVREAIISDETEYTETETDFPVTETEPTDNEANKEGVAAAIAGAVVTASTLVELRDQYGEDWLRSGGGDKLQTLLGIEETVDKVEDTDAIIHDMVAKETELQRQVSLVESELSVVSKAESRRSSEEESHDTIEKANDVIAKDEENDISASLDQLESDEKQRTRVSTVSNQSNDSTGFYSVYTDRETSPGAVDKGARVPVLRTIPGDDSGEVEELVLSITSEFIREQDLKNITRVKWFLHSIEQLDMVGRVKEEKKSLHVVGDMVKCALLFNTVRRDSRERVYTMTEAGYSTLMALAGPVLEAAASAISTTASLQCVKCQSVFSAGVAIKTKNGTTRCPNCGSSMVIEYQPDPGQGEEEEGVSLGIPACELLDLTAIAETTNRASTPRTFSRELSVEGESDSQPERPYLGQELTLSPVKAVMTNLSVTADIHDHVINSPDTNLPDLLPRPEPRRSRNSSDEEMNRLSKDKSSSPGLLRSDSSSDISVLSNPSECSIEVISSKLEQDLSVPATAVLGEPVQGELKMLDSSSSGSMVNSVVAAEVENDIQDSSQTPTKFSEDNSGSPTTPTRNRSTTSSTSLYSSTMHSPTKRRTEALDTVSIDEDSSAFHSCQEDTDTSMVEDSEVTSVGTVLDLSETLSVRSPGGSQGASPVTVKSHQSTPVQPSPLALPPDSPEPAEPISPISWNYTEFSKADHRVQLFCELSLFREEEDLLLLAKGSLHLRSSPSSVWPGVLVVTNKRIYALKITGKETVEPGDWLELKASANVQKLSRLVGLVGGQGVGLELQTNTKPVQPSFYRLPVVTGYGGGYSGEGTDCFYLIMGDRGRVDSMMDQLVERLQEAVRSTPIPVTRLSQDEEAVISAQVSRVCPEAETRVELFQMARMVEEGADDWEMISIILTPSHIVVAQDFFQWLFTSKEKELQIKFVQKIDSLENLAIYQTWPERTRLDMADLKLRLKFETEAGVQLLVGSIREVWELARGIKLEEVTCFHLSGSKEVVTMQTLLMDESVTLDVFDLTQWIKVTSQGKAKM